MTESTGTRSTFYEGCANCGDPLTDGQWHPVVTESTGDGDVDCYSFCDDDCRAEWTADV